MATQFCQKCKQSHPGRVCDYDEQGECSETPKLDEPVEPSAKREETKRVKTDRPRVDNSSKDGY